MEILVIILVFILIAMGIYLFCLKRELKNIASQLDLLTEEETNQYVTVNFGDANAKQLIRKINTYIDHQQMINKNNRMTNASQKQLILNISHDLRTPLTAIRGYLHIMEEQQKADEKQLRHLRIVIDKTQELQNLMEDFFELAKIESDSFILKLEKLNFQPIVTEALFSYYAAMTEKGIEIEVELEDELLGIADQKSLTRVINNILHNIVVHDGQNVKVRGYCDDDRLQLSFSNETQQVNAENVSLLFQRFYMVSSSRQEGNSGLGLTISKELVTKMGGTIDANYASGRLEILLSFPQK